VAAAQTSTLLVPGVLALQCQLVSQTRQTAAGPDVVLRTISVGYASGHVIPAHAHDWDQLIFASSGVMTVYTPDGSWVVPPQRAVWVPPGSPTGSCPAPWPCARFIWPRARRRRQALRSGERVALLRERSCTSFG
jgi:hypothetical protein